MCILPGALVSALANRIEAGGPAPTEAELRALLGSGCTKAELEEAFTRGASRKPDARFDEALRTLHGL